MLKVIKIESDKFVLVNDDKATVGDSMKMFYALQYLGVEAVEIIDALKKFNGDTNMLTFGVNKTLIHWERLVG